MTDQSSNVVPMRKPKPPKAKHERPASDAPWAKELLWKQTASGIKIERNVANALTILKHSDEWRGAILFDEFAGRVVIGRPCPIALEPPFPIPWGDVHDVLACAWLQRSEWHLDLGIDLVANAVQTVAKFTRWHPVRSYFDALEWDGTQRLTDWLPTYLGAEPSDYTRAVGPKWIISAVARTYEPGCKADCVLIAQGEQGRGKSTFLKVLAGEWFTDEIAEFGSKDAALQLSGALIIELAELDAMSKTEVGKTKAFLSKSSDRFRAPYGRNVADHPRQCVFAGTVNHATYLRDETGGRRFWPVSCGRIDIEALKRDRDQLWAEAVIRYREGEPWWLTDPATIAAAAGEQDARYQSDEWEQIVGEFLIGKESVSLGEILAGPLNLEKAKWGQTEQNRVARCLKRLKWDRRRIRVGADLKWRYAPQMFPLCDLFPVGKDESGNTKRPSFADGVPSVPSVPSNSLRGVGDIQSALGKSVFEGDTGNTGNTGNSRNAEVEQPKWWQR